MTEIEMTELIEEMIYVDMAEDYIEQCFSNNNVISFETKDKDKFEIVVIKK